MLTLGLLNRTVFTKCIGRNNQDGGAATQLTDAAVTTATPRGHQWGHPWGAGTKHSEWVWGFESGWAGRDTFPLDQKSSLDYSCLLLFFHMKFLLSHLAWTFFFFPREAENINENINEYLLPFCSSFKIREGYDPGFTSCHFIVI